MGAGGATKACLRLHQSFIQSGINSTLLLKDTPPTPIPSAYGYYDFFSEKRKNRSLSKKLIEGAANRLGLSETRRIERRQAKERSLVAAKQPGIEVFTFMSSYFEVLDHPAFKEADVVHLHWVSDHFLDFERFMIQCSKPIVWTLHDMNPFTGGCHYAEKCSSYTELCHICPQLEDTDDASYTKAILQRKHHAVTMRQAPILVAAPSKWLMQCSEKSTVFRGVSHTWIPYGIDTNTFKVQNKEALRHQWNIEPDRMVVLFVAVSLDSKRKGFSILLEAIKRVRPADTTLWCAVGSALPAEAMQAVPHLRIMGRIEEEQTLAELYALADVFVIPSLEDNLPNTILESLCCGTPVVGFAAGGIPDAVVPGENGFLCAEKTADALLLGIESALQTHWDRKSIAQNAAKAYALDVQMRAYLQAYHALL